MQVIYTRASELHLDIHTVVLPTQFDVNLLLQEEDVAVVEVTAEETLQ